MSLRVAVINLSGRLDAERREKLEDDIAFFRKQYSTITLRSIDETYNTDNPVLHARSLRETLHGPEGVIIAAKGGVRMVELRSHLQGITVDGQKSIVGNSDFCHIAPLLSDVDGISAYIGPCMKSFSCLSSQSQEQFERVVLRGEPLIVPPAEIIVWRPGKLHGKLVAGNDIALLNVFAMQPLALKGCVLALENHTEGDPRLLRYWLQQYKLRGLLDGIAGLIIGATPLIEDEANVKEAVMEVCRGFSFPVLKVNVFSTGTHCYPFRFSGHVMLNEQGLRIT